MKTNEQILDEMHFVDANGEPIVNFDSVFPSKTNELNLSDLSGHKNNWFMTQNRQIIDLNSMSFFWIEKSNECDGTFHVFCVNKEIENLPIANVPSLPEAEKILEQIYKKLQKK
jgi:hypothetical protein